VNAVQSTSKRCRQCKYWDCGTENRIKAEKGWCHRHAPIPTGLDFSGDYRMVFWPMTYAAEWCGDFQKLQREKP
jgi:hypothetical protein